jgi:HrpA-like RNA helicase
LEIEEAFGEIENALRREGLEAVVLPLHKDVPSAQQQECFRDWGMPRVILATNIAETSLTIPDLHVVIDTGLRRRTYLNNGVQCLGTVYATQFEATQLKGRVGRTQPGIWIDRCDVPLADRPLAPPPEILRLQPTNALLKFKAFQNLDPRDMKLLDDPGVDVWDAAEDDLKQLGLMDSAPQATELGQVIARLPISVNLGRMLVEARQRGVLKEAIYVAAAIEVNGLQDRENSEWRNVVEGLDSDSELMVQLKLFEHATHLTGQLANENDVLERGISYKNFIKAQEHAAELIRRVKLMGWTEVDQYARCRSMENALVSSFMAGFPNCVFVRHGNFYIGLDGEKRRLHGEAVTAADTQFVAGIPWDFDPNIEGMGKPKHFINYASAVSETAAMKLPYVRELLSNQKGKFEERETKMRGAQGKSGLRTHQRQVRRF